MQVIVNVCVALSWRWLTILIKSTGVEFVSSGWSELDGLVRRRGELNGANALAALWS